MQNGDARKRNGPPAGETGALEKPRYPISSVDNALTLLLMFREQRFIRVAEASNALGVGRSTAHRLLAMLQYRGLVEQDAKTKAYTSGPALVDIGLSIVRRMDVRSHLRPYLEQLRDELGETVHLMVLEGTNALFLDSVESSRALRTSSRIGRSYPAHTTSGGKVLLAGLSAEQFAQLYASEQLPELTPRSTSTRKKLLRELQLVREQGYGTNRGESEPDVAAVAVAVRNAFGQECAAIAVSAPLSRLDDSGVPAVVAALKSVVAKVESQLL